MRTIPIAVMAVLSAVSTTGQEWNLEPPRGMDELRLRWTAAESTLRWLRAEHRSADRLWWRAPERPVFLRVQGEGLSLLQAYELEAVKAAALHAVELLLGRQAVWTEAPDDGQSDFIALDFASDFKVHPYCRTGYHGCAALGAKTEPVFPEDGIWSTYADLEWRQSGRVAFNVGGRAKWDNLADPTLTAWHWSFLVAHELMHVAGMRHVERPGGHEPETDWAAFYDAAEGFTMRWSGAANRVVEMLLPGGRAAVDIMDAVELAALRTHYAVHAKPAGPPEYAVDGSAPPSDVFVP